MQTKGELELERSFDKTLISTEILASLSKLRRAPTEDNIISGSCSTTSATSHLHTQHVSRRDLNFMYTLHGAKLSWHECRTERIFSFCCVEVVEAVWTTLHACLITVFPACSYVASCSASLSRCQNLSWPFRNSKLTAWSGNKDPGDSSVHAKKKKKNVVAGDR